MNVVGFGSDDGMSSCSAALGKMKFASWTCCDKPAARSVNDSRPAEVSPRRAQPSVGTVLNLGVYVF